MIGSDPIAAYALKTDVLATSREDLLTPEFVALCREISNTVDDPRFPGGLMPVVLDSGEILVLAAASTQRAWRQLAPLLRAFSGPTLTSFTGAPTPFPAGLPAATALLSYAPQATATLRIPNDAIPQLAALRALRRLQETLARAPDLHATPPEPTGWMLARFQDYLNTGRPDAARRVLTRLREELRLDALNLGALEVQILASTQNWRAILDLPIFASLSVARRTPATTGLLLEAVYQVHLRQLFEASDPDATLRRYEDEARPLARAMLAGPLPAEGLGVWRMAGLEVLAAPDSHDLRQRTVETGADLGWLRALVDRPDGGAVVAPAPTPIEPLDQARQALSQTAITESLDAVSQALAALALLNAEELARLKTAEPFTALVRQVETEATPTAMPSDWAGWFNSLSDPSFTNAAEIARLGQDEWSVQAVAADPVHVQALLSSIEAAQNDDLASERSTLALPYLAAWLKKDPEFPRPAFRPIYSVVLTLFVMSATRGRQTYASSQILIQALLASGLSSAEYRDLIADVEELAGEGAGVETAFWLLEVLEDFMQAIAPEADARATFLHSTLSKLTPLYGRLSSLQRAAVDLIATELGWTVGSLGAPAIAAAPPDDLAARLKGKRIAIYTLTEAVSRQAATLITQAVPEAIVDCNADHGGSMQLKALAENADIFVLVWQSAKHAATDFIRVHRGNRPLLFASGRGVSSILRSIEDHVLSC